MHGLGRESTAAWRCGSVNIVSARKQAAFSTQKGNRLRRPVVVLARKLPCKSLVDAPESRPPAAADRIPPFVSMNDFKPSQNPKIGQIHALKPYLVARQVQALKPGHPHDQRAQLAERPVREYGANVRERGLLLHYIATHALLGTGAARRFSMYRTTK